MTTGGSTRQTTTASTCCRKETLRAGRQGALPAAHAVQGSRRAGDRRTRRHHGQFRDAPDARNRPSKCDQGPLLANIFVSALAIRAGPTKCTHRADRPGQAAFKMGSPRSTSAGRRMSSRSRSHRQDQLPRAREGAVSVDIKRADGSYPPLGSEVVLVAVDEGLLELKRTILGSCWRP